MGNSKAVRFTVCIAACLLLTVGHAQSRAPVLMLVSAERGDGVAAAAAGFGFAGVSAPGNRSEAAVEVRVDPAAPDAVWPAIWRAVAHGARVVAVDPGSAPIRELLRNEPPWLRLAAAAARQLRANAPLFERASPASTTAAGPRAIWTADPGFDLVLLDAQRSWLLVATNVSASRNRGSARLLGDVPYAMWVSLLDGSTMAMREDDAGPVWVFDLEPWAARVYVIDKALR